MVAVVAKKALLKLIVHVEAWKHSLDDVKLKFNVNFGPETEQVKGGEFKIYKRLPRNRSMADILCTMSMYAIQPEGNQPVLLITRDVRAWESDWLTFNVTTVMKQWASFPLTNYGFQLIVVRTLTGDEVNPHDFGIVGIRGNREKRPYLLGFVNTRKSMHSITQGIISSDGRRTRRATNWKKQLEPQTCHLQRFLVNFEKIGLNIIAPKKYYGHYCTGTCVHALANATNHALVQVLAHLVDAKNVPDPCCAPNALKPLSILFIDNNNNVVLRKHAEMIATSCACQ